MNINFLKSKEKKKILDELNERFGITELPGLLLETGKQKIRGFSGTMTREEITEIGAKINIEIVGLYLIKRERDYLRLSMDATQVLAKGIKKNIIELNDEDFSKWIRTNDLPIKKDKGVYAIKHGNDFIGCAYSNGEKLFNFVPKERSVRSSSER